MGDSMNVEQKSSYPSFKEKLDELADCSFSPAIRGNARIANELSRRGPDGHFLGGIVHESVRGTKGKITNVVHIANPYQIQPLDVVTLPTRCSREEIEQIRSRIIPMKESYELLLAIAKAFEQRHPILIEGDTSVGKTFIVNRFMELLYGDGARPLDFYCSGQTDVSELIGKWAPKTSGLNDDDRKLLDDFMLSPYGKDKIAAVQNEVKQMSGLPSSAQHALLKHRLIDLVSQLGLSSSVQWEFSYGAVPKAMICNVNKDGKNVNPSAPGSGTILKIDEVGLAEPAVVMALLRIRGEAGKLADKIQLWEAGGEVIRAGHDFFVIYTTNPSGQDYLERKEIDPALARSVIWLKKDTLSEESLALAAKKYLSYSIGNDPGTRPLRCVIDLRIEPEIAGELADLASLVHRRYVQAMKKGEAGRRQKIPGSLDHLARLASYVLSNQVLDVATGKVDFGETLKRAVDFVYLAGVSDNKVAETIKKELHMLLDDRSLGEKHFRGKKLLRSEILTILSDEASARQQLPQSSTMGKGPLSSRQHYSDISDSLLAQLDANTLSLRDQILPQITEAIEIFEGEDLKEELLEEIASKDRPGCRSEIEWGEFVEALNNIRRGMPGSCNQQLLVA